MRILFVTPWFPTLASPVSGVFVRRDAELLSERHDIEIVHLHDPELVSDDDIVADRTSPIRVHRLPMARNDPFAPLRAWRRLRPLVESVDLVHSHAFQALLPFAWHRIGRPWVHSEHWSGVASPESFNAKGRFIFALTSRLLRRPDVVTAVSTFLLERVREHRSGTTMIVPSVVLPAIPAPAQHTPGELRLVTVANLVEGKDPMLAIDTVEELRSRNIPASLRWVGDGPMRKAVETRIKGNSTVTLLGALDRDGVAGELAAAEIFLLPTRSETLCLSAIEAISHGRPVVMGAHGGQRDYVNVDNGILVAERSAQAYADAVQEVSDAFSRLSPSTVAATVSGRFTPARVLELYEGAYDAAYAQYNAKVAP